MPGLHSSGLLKTPKRRRVSLIYHGRSAQKRVFSRRLGQDMPIMSSWENLASAVASRRAELGLTQVDVAERGEVSVDMIRNIEHVRRTPKRVKPATARALEYALQWEPGSVETALAGGDPVPASDRARLSPRTAASAATPDEQRASPTAVPTAEAVPADVAAPPETGDRFALARQLVALRSTLSAHQHSISAEAREALEAEMAVSAREAEESIIRLMPWLDDAERGEAIQLLVRLREPLS